MLMHSVKWLGCTLLSLQQGWDWNEWWGWTVKGLLSHSGQGFRVEECNYRTACAVTHPLLGAHLGASLHRHPFSGLGWKGLRMRAQLHVQAQVLSSTASRNADLNGRIFFPFNIGWTLRVSYGISLFTFLCVESWVLFSDLLLKISHIS